MAEILKQTIVEDFNRFTRFIDEEKPILSTKMAVLGKKDSFTLNSMLLNKKEVKAPLPEQKHYPVIDLMFYLALDGGLYVRENDEKKSTVLAKTQRMESYSALNLYEKYIYLFQVYWTIYDFRNRHGEFALYGVFNSVLEVLAEAKAGVRITYSDHPRTLRVLRSGEDTNMLFHLKCFGFCDLEPNEKRYNNKEVMQAIIPDLFGIKSAQYLLNSALMHYQQKYPSDVDIIFGISYDENDEKEHPFDLFKGLLPDAEVNRTVQGALKYERRGNYVFRVCLKSNRKVWRKIRLSHKRTLDCLHNAVFDSFHASKHFSSHTFYIGDKYKNSIAIYSQRYNNTYIARYRTIRYSTNEICIGELNLLIGQKMWYEYRYDCDEEYEFEVQLVDIERDMPEALHVEVIGKKGDIE